MDNSMSMGTERNSMDCNKSKGNTMNCSRDKSNRDNNRTKPY